MCHMMNWHLKMHWLTWISGKVLVLVTMPVCQTKQSSQMPQISAAEQLVKSRGSAGPFQKSSRSLVFNFSDFARLKNTFLMWKGRVYLEVKSLSLNTHPCHLKQPYFVLFFTRGQKHGMPFSIQWKWMTTVFKAQKWQKNTIKSHKVGHTINSIYSRLNLYALFPWEQTNNCNFYTKPCLRFQISFAISHVQNCCLR